METRTCEICGKPTAEADFSKSYKNRCKACVAEQTRERRAEQKENPNDTGDIPRSQWAWPTPVPVKESRLFELTKAALQGLLANPVWMQLQIQNTKESCQDKTAKGYSEHLKRELAEDAVEMAQAALAELERIENPNNENK